ncbi:MAG: urease accessory protein UreF [Myxococcaceae bacterium]|nr:urease accessory protein UreF [Myxococcaceae bacterium]
MSAEPSPLVGPSRSLMRLLWLASPALPIGAYAYSRGLEYAVDAGFIHDVSSAASWISGVLQNQIATLDAPVLARLHDAYAAGAALDVERWNRLLCAARESAEAQLEDRQLGLSLGKVLREAGVERALGVPAGASYAQWFALACVHFGASRADAVLAYMFAFAEGQVTAASKLVPLGQSAAQRVLTVLMSAIEPLAASALTLEDDALGAYTPGLALASMLHETQYTRLFRS